MKFGKNLQKIRKAQGLSQEELADKMQVSRQAISKWESGAAYPEMEKLVELSEVLNCSVDGLVKGGVDVTPLAPVTNDKTTYDNLMNKFSKQISIAIMLILVGSSALLGVSSFGMPWTDYGLVIFLIFVAAGVPIFVTRGIELGNYKIKHPKLENFYTEDEIDIYNGKFTKIITTAIGIIMAGLVVFMGLVVTNYFGTESPMPAAVFMLFVAVAAPMFVYAGIQKGKYDIVRYNRENSLEYKAMSERIGKISGVIMMVATITFMLLGYLGNAWAMAWLAFPVGGILCGIVAVILQKDIH